jgi:hypothetical protein
MVSTSGQFAIALDPPSMSWTDHGTLSGQLVVWLDGHAFPDESWQDYPVPVLEWWCRACADLLDGADSARLELMDGPFSLQVHQVSDGRWRLRAMRNDDPMPATPHDPVPAMPAQHLAPGEVLRCLVGAGRTVLDLCERRGWTSPDVDALGAAVDDLRGRIA